MMQLFVSLCACVMAACIAAGFVIGVIALYREVFND